MVIFSDIAALLLAGREISGRRTGRLSSPHESHDCRKDCLARKMGQILARGKRRWLVRVYLGRDRQSHRRIYHNRTIRGGLREAQRYLNARLRERDLGKNLEGNAIICNEFLDRWLRLAAQPKLRHKSYQDYQALLARYVRPKLGNVRLGGLTPLDIQAIYQEVKAYPVCERWLVLAVFQRCTPCQSSGTGSASYVRTP
jgi:hypothetical protein